MPPLRTCKSGKMHAFLCRMKGPLMLQVGSHLKIGGKKGKEKTKFSSKVGDNLMCSWCIQSWATWRKVYLSSMAYQNLQSTQLGASW